MSKQELLKTNVPGFLKDPETGVVINNNYNELEAHYMARQKAKELAEVKNNVDELKRNFNEIKTMLRQILEGTKK